MKQCSPRSSKDKCACEVISDFELTKINSHKLPRSYFEPCRGVYSSRTCRRSEFSRTCRRSEFSSTRRRSQFSRPYPAHPTNLTLLREQQHTSAPEPNTCDTEFNSQERLRGG